MRRIERNISLFTLTMASLLFAATFPLLADDHDPMPDPPKVAAEIGQDKVGNYHFTCSSEVKINKNGLFTYTNSIMNNHPTKILPVRWLQAELESDGIPPAENIQNKYDSHTKFKVNETTSVEYGAKLQEKGKASLYMPMIIVGDFGKKDNKDKLTSTIATSTGEDKVKHLITVTSEVNDGGKTYIYTFEGTKSNDLIIIPALRDTWKEPKNKVVMSGMTFDIKKSAYVVSEKTGSITASLNPPENVESIDKPYSIKISNEKYSFAGKVSLYLPAPEKK